MNVSTLVPLALFMSIAIACAQSGTGPQDATIEPIEWPQTDMPKLATDLSTYEFDGMFLTRFEIIGKAFHYGLDPLAGWSRVRPNSDESLALVQTARPEHRIALSLFTPNAFLPDLSPASISGYIEGLRKKYGERFTLLNEGKHNPKEAPFLLGSNWRIVEYRLLVAGSKEGEVLEMLHRDYLLFPEGYFMVLRHSGPANLVEARADFIMRYFSRYQDLLEDSADEATAKNTAATTAERS